MNKNFKAGALYLAATIIETLVSFITLPFFTRILTPEDYGALALAQIYGLMAAGLANFGLATAYNRNYFEHHEDKKRTGELFFTTIGFVCITSALIVCFTLIFQTGLAKIFLRSYHHPQLLLWALVANILVNLRLFFLTYLRNIERPKQYVINAAALAILNLAFSLYFVLYLQIGVIGILMGQVLSSFVILLGLLIQFLKELPVGWNTKLLKEELRIGVPVVPTVFFGIITNHFDKYLLGLLSTVGGVGLYSIGQKIAGLNFTFMTSLQNVFSPQVYKLMFSGTPESKKEIGVYLLPFAYIICFVALLIVLFADEIIRVMAAPIFAPAANIIIALTLFNAVLFFAKINGDQLIFAKKTHLTTLLLVGAAILNIIFNIPFIYIAGAFGAAWATLLARIISGIYIFKTAQKFFKIEWQTNSMCVIFGSLFFLALGLVILRMQPVAYGGLLLYKLLAIGFYLYISKIAKVNLHGFLSSSHFGGR